MSRFLHLCSTCTSSVKRLKSFPHDCRSGVRLSAPKGALLQTINNIQYCKWTSAIPPSSFDVGDECFFFCEACAVAAPRGSGTYEWLIKRSLGATALYWEPRGLNQPLPRPLPCCRYQKCIIYLSLFCIYTKLIYIDSCRQREGFIRFHSGISAAFSETQFKLQSSGPHTLIC